MTAVEQLPDEPMAPVVALDIRSTGNLPVFPGHQEMLGMAAMAVTLSAAAAVPKDLRQRPNDVFLILLTGRELGIPPTTALRECHVIDGKVTISPKVKLALVRQSGLGKVWPDQANSATSATWYGVRADQPDVTHASTFTWEDAQRVKISSSKQLTDKDNWLNYPRRMLSWRAVTALLDDVFSECATGMFSPDELGGMTDGEGQIIDVASADPLPGTSAPRGHTPPPPAPPIGEDDLAEITRRLQAIAVVPEAKATLLEMWTRRKEDGTPTLGPPAELQARHVVVAKAMLTSIEQRMTKGEWGDGLPDDEAGVDPRAALLANIRALAKDTLDGDVEASRAVVSWATAARTTTPDDCTIEDLDRVRTCLLAIESGERALVADDEGRLVVGEPSEPDPGRPF